MRRDVTDGGAQKLNDRMRLRKMNAGRIDFFPKIGNRIEANEGCTAFDVKQKDVENLKQDFGIFKVEVDLIGTEGRPNFFLARWSFE